MVGCDIKYIKRIINGVYRIGILLVQDVIYFKKPMVFYDSLIANFDFIINHNLHPYDENTHIK